MAKNSIRDYSATNSDNTDIQSIDISEGCSPAGINNAIREVMADLKDVSTGAVALESPAFDSASLTGDLTFGDNDKAIFGAGSDLQIYHDGSNSIINDAGTGSLKFQYGGTDGVVFDSSGNVGIGTSSPATALTVASEGKLRLYRSDNARYGDIYADNSFFNIETSNDPIKLDGQSYIRFDVAADEKMRIDSSGNVLVGVASVGANNSNSLSFYKQYGQIYLNHSGTDNGTYYSAFVYNGTVIGSITQNSTSSVSYNTSSDHRLKENVTADWDATTRLKQLNPVRFNFIADADTTVDGFLAHEVQDVVPEAINGTKDAMRDEEYTVSAATGDIYTPAIEAVLDEDGNEVTPAVAEVIHSTDVERPEELAEGQQWRETTAAVMGTRSVPDYQGIDQSKLVPLLVKTIQELEARITALEAN